MKTYTPEQLAAIERKVNDYANCYADTWDQDGIGAPMVQGESIRAMTLDNVVKLITSDFAAQLHSKPQQWISPNTPPEIGVDKEYPYASEFVLIRVKRFKKVLYGQYEHVEGQDPVWIDVNGDKFCDADRFDIIVTGWLPLPDTKGEAKEMYTEQQIEQRMVEFTSYLSDNNYAPSDGIWIVWDGVEANNHDIVDMFKAFKAKGGKE